MDGCSCAAYRRLLKPARIGVSVGELVDLSHAYDANAIFWPAAGKFRLDTVPTRQDRRVLLRLDRHKNANKI